MVRPAISVRIVSSLACVAMLAGCAQTLPAPEGAAFAKLAAADKDAFGSLADQDAAAGLAVSQALMEDNAGRVVIDGCGSAATGDCTLTYTVAGTDYRLITSGVHARALIGAIARYSDQMSTLAQAKDLDDLKAKSQAAAGSLKGLAAVAAPGVGLIATPIIDAALFIGDASLRDKRRRAMLKIALAAQLIIERSAKALEDEAVLFKSDILKNAALSITRTQGTIIDNQARERAFLGRRKPASLSPADYSQLEALRDKRSAGLATLNQQARTLTAARRMPTTFQPLIDAHKALIAKLQNPEISMEDAIAQVDQFLSILDEVKAATASK